VTPKVGSTILHLHGGHQKAPGECQIVYDFVVQKPILKATKNLDLEALFSQTQILDLKAEKQGDQLLYRMKVQDASNNQRVEKLMDYLKYRGCHVSVISRYVAE
jgi:hypothetical protein